MLLSCKPSLLTNPTITKPENMHVRVREGAQLISKKTGRTILGAFVFISETQRGGRWAIPNLIPNLYTLYTMGSRNIPSTWLILIVLLIYTNA